MLLMFDYSKESNIRTRRDRIRLASGTAPKHRVVQETTRCLTLTLPNNGTFTLA